ncbi:MBL fold metallo-hydrolase [Rickettsiales bacterium]|nr:MBL fold metallo-hydrolase [Rickettsiales bacterium]
MKKFYSVIIFTLLMTFSANAQSDVVTTKIRDNIYFLVSPKGGNIVLSTGNDGAFIIDDQLADRSKIIEEQVRSISNSEIKFILNTHFHFDHTGGNEFFGSKKAIIMAHNNVQKRLSTEQFITYFKRQMPALSKTGLPKLTFTDNITLHYNDDEVRITHMPNAHTDGDAIVYFVKNNIIVAGDIIFSGLYPFIDTEHGGSITGIINALEKLLKLSDDKTIIAPGHGPLMNKSDLKSYRDMLIKITNNIKAAIKEGKNLDEVIAQKPTKDFDALMEKGIVSPDSFTTIVYESLTNE